jgi:hypothetical protein
VDLRQRPRLPTLLVEERLEASEDAKPQRGMPRVPAYYAEQDLPYYGLLLAEHEDFRI